MRETIKLASTNNEQLSGFLREVLTSLNKPRQDQKAEKPIAPALPTEFKIGNRTYELVPLLKKGERSIRDASIVDRAKELDANLGEEDGQFILERQDKIPQEFRGKFLLVFTAWHDPSYPQDIAYLNWYDDRWYRAWGWIGYVWDKDYRLVRCRPATNPA